MKLIVLGATGKLGQHVWRMAVAAGHDVVAYVRTPTKLDQADPGFAKLKVVTGDVMDADAVRNAAAGCSVMVNCTSPAGGNSTIDLAKNIVPNAKAAGVEKFYMVGGMGALWAPGTDKKILVQDWDDFEAYPRYGLSTDMPREMIKKMTAGHLLSMAFMKELDVPHTFLCPGFMVDGPPSESRVVTLDELGGTSASKVKLSDIAKVIVDDLEKGALLGHRVCVSSE